MPKLTPQQLKERYQRLPADVQEAYFSVETGEILQKIGKEHNLTTEKIGIMADEAGLLMLGLTHPNNFISNLAERMEIDKDLAKKIAYQINDQIFKKIRESLRVIHQKPDSSQKVQKTKKPHTSVIKPITKESLEDQPVPKTIEPHPSFAEKNTRQILDVEEETKEMSSSPLPPPPKIEETKENKKPQDTSGTETKKETEDKKEIFEERKKIFRSNGGETIVKKEPPKPNYPEGVDPYREPVE